MIFSKKNGGDILMKRVAVVTDSNSGITQAKAAELKISVLPMPFFINGEQYLEDINMSQSQFYEALKSDAEIHTSQPSPATLPIFGTVCLPLMTSWFIFPCRRG